MTTVPFGATTTAAEVAAGLDLTGKRAIVTGGGSGIGAETARVLAAAGAEVTATTRADLDLADPAGVDRFVRRWSGPLHILVNNAGVMATPETRTPEGRELQFATNHLGHFQLALGLHDALAAAEGARVVVVSSVGHVNGEVLFDDVDFARHPYDPWAAYSQSKTANILFAVEFDRRHKDDGVRATAVHPGAIRTELTRHMGADELQGLIDRINTERKPGEPAFGWKTVPQGAATSVWAGIVASADEVGGRYCEDCHVARLVNDPESRSGVRSYALDPDHAKALWAKSEEMVGERF